MAKSLSRRNKRETLLDNFAVAKPGGLDPVGCDNPERAIAVVALQIADPAFGQLAEKRGQYPRFDALAAIGGSIGNRSGQSRYFFGVIAIVTPPAARLTSSPVSLALNSITTPLLFLRLALPRPILPIVAPPPAAA